MNESLHYQLYNESYLQQGSNPPLLILHGLLGSLENWNTFCRAQQQTQRSMIAVDLRNHGRSPHVAGMSYSLMVADIACLLDALQLTQLDVMGHSMGGKVAMCFALQQPQRVKRLIVVDILPKDYPPHHQALLKALLSMPLGQLKNRKEADEWLAPTVTQAFERAFLLKNLQRAPEGGFQWRCHLSEIARHYLNISRFPEITAQYSGETLLIRGAQSDYVAMEQWPHAKQYFPQAELVNIEKAGHLPHIQTPEVFTEQVEQFLV